MDRCAPVICDEVHTRKAHAYVMSVSLRISFFETNCRKDVTHKRKSETNGRQRRAPRTGPGGNRRCRTGHRHIFHMVRHPQRRAKSLRRHDHVCRRIARRRCPDTVNAAIRSGRATNRARFRTIDGRPRSLTAPNASREEARPSVQAPSLFDEPNASPDIQADGDVFVDNCCDNDTGPRNTAIGFGLHWPGIANALASGFSSAVTASGLFSRQRRGPQPAIFSCDFASGNYRSRGRWRC